MTPAQIINRRIQADVENLIDRQHYVEMIGEKFVAMRGVGFDLSATDRALIDCWHDRGIPIWIPFSILDEIGSRKNAKHRARIRHLGYIEDEIEARFAEYREGRAGAA